MIIIFKFLTFVQNEMISNNLIFSNLPKSKAFHFADAIVMFEKHARSPTRNIEQQDFHIGATKHDQFGPSVIRHSREQNVDTK